MRPVARRGGDHGAWAMTVWMLRYPLRRRRALLVVLATMAAEIALVLLGPWPMKIMVDTVLGTEPLPAVVASALGSVTQGPIQLILMVVAAQAASAMASLWCNTPLPLSLICTFAAAS